MIAALLLAAAAPAAPAPAPADRVLGCRLTTPAGDEIAFTARLGMPSGVLEPVPGVAWPMQRVIGTGAWREGKGFEARYYFAGKPSNVDLRIEGERTTLFVGKKLRTGQPRAVGFCLPLANPSPVAANATVSPSAGADVPAFDSARWPEICSLVTRSGRRARIDYTILDRGARSEIKAAEAWLLASGRVAVPRVQGSRGAHFGGRAGPAGRERLVVDENVGEAVQLLDFERIGTAAFAEPAAAICGHTGIVRRPAAQ